MALEGRHSEPRRIALVHDFLVSMRGADRVFLEMCELWPDADIFTPIYDARGTEGRFSHRRVHTSFLQRVHPSRRTFRALLPFYPAAMESFDLRGFDLVVSSSSAWAHAVLCDESAVHVSYCHNPFRYAWNERHRAIAERADPVTRAALRGFFRRWREWDWIAAQRVDRYLTNSATTRARIKTYFGRDAHIVHPPVRIERFKPQPPGSHYMVLSELISHKRIDVAVQAFGELGLPLIVAGDGPDRRRLSRHAPPNVKFPGRISDAEAAHLLATCRAFVVTAVEEFGIAAVEAQAAGRPVIARHGGGALATVNDGVTGCFWEGGAGDLAATVRAFDAEAVDPQACVDNARRFDAANFRRELPRQIELAIAESTAAADNGGRETRILARSRMPGTRRARAVPRP